MVKKYTHLLFDLDNTLLDFDTGAEEALQNTFAHFELPFNEAIQLDYEAINTRCWKLLEKGKMSRETLRPERFRRLFEKHEIKQEAQPVGVYYLQQLAQSIHEIEGAQSLLERLSTSFTLGIITNGLKEVQRPRLNKVKWNHFFKTIVVSDEIGLSKPDPAYFDYALEELDNPPINEVLVIGDSFSSDMRGAYISRIDSCWFHPDAKKVNHDICTHQIDQLHELFAIVGIE